ncbi:MAG: acyl-CoA dehydrogenase [Betaproteobacteria bacterium]|nr:acyl-CoA dehydrogenase [Betaproteobacteria bacterium]
MTTTGLILVALATVLVLGYFRAPALGWTAGIGLLLFAATMLDGIAPGLRTALWSLFVLGALLFNLPALRRSLISAPVLNRFRKILPQVSQTEQEALDAGTVWWDGQIFSGSPDWNKLLSFPKPRLSSEEQAFLDGPVEELCRMLDDWKITHELYDLPPEVWQFMKEKGFLGMIIPKEHGGLGFSALAHSEVVMKLTSRSGTGAVSVMVPNSLGPAELLLHYGTDAQKKHYLPRLAKGLEIPCFALTGPEAGSDAASIPDFGIVCRGEFEGRKDVLGMRVTWEKRYITLGPVATVLGLAFRLYDPDHLLGDNEDVGITVGLIPTSTPGVVIGRRHLPLNSAFQNGPTSGKDVFIPLDWVMGGRERVGQGWRMLMNSLAAGRSISLPANGTGMAKLCSRATGAYGRVRTQFRTPIGRFEGIEEALARIGGNTYMMDAARVMTAGAVDLGEKPAVASAIVKYHLTERARQVINDAMDVHGGKGICMGPRNYLARAYQQTPIAITVEGANILTRSMIIFGQGAIRCHPYVLKEIAATREVDGTRAVADFDDAFFGHINFVVSNAARALLLGVTGARLAAVPGGPHTRRYYQQLSRLSAAFALVADVSMLVVGGALKRKEKLSARLGDILSQIYLCSATLKRFEDDGRPDADLPLLHWSMQDALVRIQAAMDGLLQNFPIRVLGLLLRLVVFPTGKPFVAPGDRLGHQVSDLLLTPGDARNRLTHGIYLPKAEGEILADLERAFIGAVECEAVEARVRAAVKRGEIGAAGWEEQVKEALAKGVISSRDREILERQKQLRRAVIMVDDFPADFGRSQQPAAIAAAPTRNAA